MGEFSSSSSLFSVGGEAGAGVRSYKKRGGTRRAKSAAVAEVLDGFEMSGTELSEEDLFDLSPSDLASLSEGLGNSAAAELLAQRDQSEEDPTKVP